MARASTMKSLFASTVLVASGVAPAMADGRLHILHFNDFHSRVESINRFNSTCSASDEAEGKCYGGAARLVTLLNQMRDAITAQGDTVVVLNAGDSSQGSLFYTTYGGRIEAELNTRLGIDTMVVGNHEFDKGPEGLAVFLDTANYPILGANIDVSANNLLAGRLAPYTIIERNGMRIGVIGVLAADSGETSSPGPTVAFTDEAEALRAAVAELEGQGVNTIIALTHTGYVADQRYAAMIPGIDAVVGGHSHTYLSATDERRQGAYPTWVSTDDGRLVPVVQAGAFGRYLGHLVMELDAEGNVAYAEGNTIEMNAEVAPDPETAAWVAGLAGPIDEMRSRVVAESSASIDGDRANCRQRECQMGNLVADAMLARVADQGVSIAIQNGGGMRASIDEGPVTMGEVLTVLPFQNTLATFQLSGASVVAALENGVSQLEENAGRFAQVAGLHYTFDPTLPAGARVSNVMVQQDGAWVPIDPTAIYGVVSNDFMRAGGDGFRMFRNEAINAYDYGPDLADVLAEYMAANMPYGPVIDGRITRVGE